MDASTRECPQCGYDYMEFYESLKYIRYLCPDCGYEDVKKEKEIGGKRSTGIYKRTITQK